MAKEDMLVVRCISSLHPKERHAMVSQQRGDAKYYYIGKGIEDFKESSTLANPYKSHEIGEDLAFTLFKRLVRYNPVLWEELDRLEGKTILCDCKRGVAHWCHVDVLSELLWEKKSGIECTHARKPVCARARLRCRSSGEFQGGHAEHSATSIWAPEPSMRRPLTFGEVCPSDIPDKKSKNDNRGILLTTYDNPNCHTSYVEGLCYGTGTQRVTHDGTAHRFTVRSKAGLLRVPNITNHMSIFLAGHSQLRTFTSGRVPCPPEWAVLSVPGGLFGHVEDGIRQVMTDDLLHGELPDAVVLQCGTNDLTGVVTHDSWKKCFRRLVDTSKHFFPHVPTFVIAPLPRRDDKRVYVPHLTRAMAEVCLEYSPNVVLLDFTKDFPLSDSDLWALDDPVHLSDDHGLPLLQRKLSDELARQKSLIENQQSSGDSGYPDWMWKNLKYHIRGSVRPKSIDSLRVGTPRPRGVDNHRHPAFVAGSAPRYGRGGRLGNLDFSMEDDPNVHLRNPVDYCAGFSRIPEKWNRQYKMCQDMKKSTFVVGRNRNTHRRKKIVMHQEKKCLPKRLFPCIEKGCRHGWFSNDIVFLDHVIKKHSTRSKLSKRKPDSSRDASLEDTASLDAKLSFFTSEGLLLAVSATPTYSSGPAHDVLPFYFFQVSTRFAWWWFWSWGGLPHGGRVCVSSTTTVHNYWDAPRNSSTYCSRDSNVTSSLVSIYSSDNACSLYSFVLLLLCGDIESNPGPAQNKRKASDKGGSSSKEGKKSRIDSGSKVNVPVRNIITLASIPSWYDQHEANSSTDVVLNKIGTYFRQEMS